MKTLKWGLLYTAAFLAAFVGSALLKMNSDPTHGKYNTRWDETVGKAYTDLPYGEGAANKFDLYVPADKSQDAYGLVVYLHAGGFTGGDKAEDAEMLEWLCSKGYVAAGINYTLFTEENPDASVYSQSEEIKAAMPYVVAAAEKLGYKLDRMAISGGSAGGCLALLYAYRDADTSPLPVRMVFEAVGPGSFHVEDWGIFGLDQSPAAAAGLFSVMSGQALTPEDIASRCPLFPVSSAGLPVRCCSRPGSAGPALCRSGAAHAGSRCSSSTLPAAQSEARPPWRSAHRPDTASQCLPGTSNRCPAAF